MAGNFFQTAQEIRVDDGHFLRGRLQRVDGEWVDAEINLNDHLGNNNGMCTLTSTFRDTPSTNVSGKGHFAWDSAGFANSAEDIRLSIEGDGPVAVLRARLRNENGEWQDSDINLSERLGNNNGGFYWS
ncbi:cyanovirin-N family protein [Truncatella angustata]|uniref:Cyanovirin-N family protein n=1 Tax=Truncatella angustata TaxID=152316 RepID=A0A9P8UIY3_9PEZI|nr:cyanovirin-N family protein [Truncatella angustata]KAH6653228.1 cyanovirin-N family protein [Truncatella angustata]KAH8198934.1 hypothetical protein TruAng_006895 [Truncatella angustata]